MSGRAAEHVSYHLFWRGDDLARGDAAAALPDRFPPTGGKRPPAGELMMRINKCVPWRAPAARC